MGFFLGMANGMEWKVLSWEGASFLSEGHAMGALVLMGEVFKKIHRIRGGTQDLIQDFNLGSGTNAVTFQGS